jgi:polyhydroxybutyrate depolymerase
VRRAILALILCACGTSGDDASTTGPDASAPPAPPPGVSPAPPASDAGDDGPTSGACAGKAGAKGERTVKITSGGIERSFVLHVPAKYDASKAGTLVFAFHGYTMDPAAMETATHLATVSDDRGFVLVYPAGTSAGFNAGECCGPAVSNKIDDIGFTRDMLASVTKEYCIDPKRIYETGFSNGGFMAYRFACEMSDVFAAVASVSGTLGIPPDSCKPTRAVPLMHVHGTNDIVVPYNGGGIGGNRSVDLSVSTIRAKNGCDADAGAGKNVYTNNDVSCTEWGPCNTGSHVRLCTVTGGAHAWPSGDGVYAGSKNLDASNAILDFFEAHPMP